VRRFGSERWTTGTQPNQYRFAGEQIQAGIQYLRARYYDTSTGRFLSKDPAGPDYLAPQSLNPYVYVRNNPANLTDPTGLCIFGLPCPSKEDIEKVLKAVQFTTVITLDVVAISFSGVAALITDVSTVIGCVGGGPVGCMVGYARGRALSLNVYAIANAASFGSLMVGCSGHFTDEECSETLSLFIASLVYADPNAGLIIDIETLCHDLEVECIISWQSE
jgi:RHS repeat-associated protein